MRSCIYCGKSLEKGEKCDCSQSIKARQAKSAEGTYNSTESDAKASGNNAWHNTDNVYTTGYTKKEKKKRFSGFKRKVSYNKIDMDKFFGIVKRFIKDPVNTVLNPGNINTLQMILMVVFEGIVVAGCWFFISNRLFAGVTRTLMQGIGVPLVRQYNIVEFILTVIFGGIGAAIFLMLVFLVFWCIGRFILKQQTAIHDFCVRLAVAVLPVAILGILGILTGFFAVYALLILSCTGIIMWGVLTYEALRCEWSFLSASKVFYFMLIGVFMVLVILFNINRV